MSQNRVFLVFAWLLLLSPQCALAEKIIIQLKWLHQFQFAGFYAAEKQGYFAELGLDVALRPRDLQKNPIEQVLNGEAHYGVADSVLAALSSPWCPFGHRRADFAAIAFGLADAQKLWFGQSLCTGRKKVAFYQKDIDIFPTIAMLEQIGVATQIDRIYKRANPEILLRGEVAAYPAYLTDDPHFFKERGVAINVLQPRHYGVDLYGDILFTTKQERENQPQRLQKIRQAVIKGWEYALANPGEMAQYILDTYQPAGRTLDYLHMRRKLLKK